MLERLWLRDGFCIPPAIWVDWKNLTTWSKYNREVISCKMVDLIAWREFKSLLLHFLSASVRSISIHWHFFSPHYNTIRSQWPRGQVSGVNLNYSDQIFVFRCMNGSWNINCSYHILFLTSCTYGSHISCWRANWMANRAVLRPPSLRDVSECHSSSHIPPPHKSVFVRTSSSCAHLVSVNETGGWTLTPDNEHPAWYQEMYLIERPRVAEYCRLVNQCTPLPWGCAWKRNGFKIILGVISPLTLREPANSTNRMEKYSLVTSKLPSKSHTTLICNYIINRPLHCGDTFTRRSAGV